MMTKTSTLTRVLVIRPGATEFDDQGRIKGSLDMPLSENGRHQVASLAADLKNVRIKVIYSSPCESARETAEALAEDRDARIKVIDAFRNVDHGLWHGKLIDEVKRNHPKVYRSGQETPEEFCSPQGEPISKARERVTKSLRKCIRKHSGVIAIVVPDPLASILESLISGEEMSDLWKAETDEGQWRLIESANAS